MIRYFRFASVVLILLLVAMVSALTTMHFAIHGAEVKVPNFKGMTIDEAHHQAAGMGLNLSVDNHYYSGDVPVDRVLSQSPAPGTIVRRDWHVRVAGSLGPQKVTVPDVVGMPERMATLELRRKSLDVAAAAHLPYSGATAGTVIGQDPTAGARGIERPAVNLLIADADETAVSGWVMPDFTGQMATAAQATLTKAGLRVAAPHVVEAKIQPVGEPGQPLRPVAVPGTVIGQTPSAGHRVDASMTVTLTVVK